MIVTPTGGPQKPGTDSIGANTPEAVFGNAKKVLNNTKDMLGKVLGKIGSAEKPYEGPGSVGSGQGAAGEVVSEAVKGIPKLWANVAYMALGGAMIFAGVWLLGGGGAVAADIAHAAGVRNARVTGRNYK